MAEKKMLILPADLVKKIDDNRGDLSRADFIDFLIDSCLSRSEEGEVSREELEAIRAELKKTVDDIKKASVTRDEIKDFEGDVKRILKSFIDFAINYGLELGRGEGKDELKELSSRLKELGEEDEGGEVKIKWKHE